MGRCKTGKENEIDTRCGGRKARRRGRRAGARGKGGRWSIVYLGPTWQNFDLCGSSPSQNVLV